jgi:hypothetical protein
MTRYYIIFYFLLAMTITHNLDRIIEKILEIGLELL